MFNIPGLWLDNAVIFTVSIPRLKYQIFLADYHLRHLVNNVAIHMIASEWTYLYCIWKFHGINCPFHWCNFHGINSTFEISWDIFRILADYCLHHLVNDVAIYICPTHDYIKMAITVLYLKFHGINYQFNGRKYSFTGSANASSVNSICDHQICVKFSNTIAVIS